MAKYIYPVVGGSNTNTWGAPRSGGRKHAGQDIFAPKGSRILAMADGVITGADSTNNYTAANQKDLGGITVWVQDIYGVAWYYAHCLTLNVKLGDTVKQGDVIALVGNTGNAATTPPHCHLGAKTPTRVGVWFNPQSILVAAGPPEANDGGINPGTFNPITGIGGAIGNLPNPLAAVGDMFDLVKQVVGILFSPDLWRRAGLVLAGGILFILGILLIGLDNLKPIADKLPI